MNDIFSSILGQSQVRDFLRRSVRGKRISQSYLFLGPCGSNKTQAAYCLAAAYLCEDESKTLLSDCNKCEKCKQIFKRRHPDVKYYAPEGQNGYLVSQIRELIHDCELRPNEGDKKVYIIDRVDTLGQSAANAFLKTLEEPSEGILFILLGRTADGVLQTIRSRTEIVPFRHIPPEEAQKIIVQNTGCDIDRAKIALVCSGNSISKAIEILRSQTSGVLALRQQLVTCCLECANASDWEVLKEAKRIVELLGAQTDAYKKQLEEKDATSEDFLSSSAKKEIKSQGTRKQKSKVLENLNMFANIVVSVLRDCVNINCGNLEIVNSDFAERINAISPKTTYKSSFLAIERIEDVVKTMTYNVSHETCIDVILLEFKGAFKQN